MNSANFAAAGTKPERTDEHALGAVDYWRPVRVLCGSPKAARKIGRRRRRRRNRWQVEILAIVIPPRRRRVRPALAKTDHGILLSAGAQKGEDAGESNCSSRLGAQNCRQPVGWPARLDLERRRASEEVCVNYGAPEIALAKTARQQAAHLSCRICSHISSCSLAVCC